MMNKIKKMLGIKPKMKLEFKGKIPKKLDSKEFRDELEKLSTSIIPFFKNVDAALTNKKLKKSQKEAIAMSMGTMVMDSYAKILDKHLNMKKIVCKNLKIDPKVFDQKNFDPRNFDPRNLKQGDVPEEKPDMSYVG